MYRRTKNLIFLSAFLLVLFTSCKKENTNVAIGTISVSIDGTATTFNFGAKASVLPVTGGYGIQIQGNKRDPATSATNLTISVASAAPITTGTYVENSGGNVVKIDYDFDYFLSTSTSSSYGSTTNPVTITITEINSTSVKGTFSGELQGAGIGGGDLVKNVLADGVFYVSF